MGREQVERDALPQTSPWRAAESSEGFESQRRRDIAWIAYHRLGVICGWRGHEPKYRGIQHKMEGEFRDEETHDLSIAAARSLHPSQQHSAWMAFRMR